MQIFISSIFIILLYNCSLAQNENEISTRINDYLAAIENAGFYGAVIVEKNGEVLVMNGYGYSDAEKRIKNSPSTVFDIGSLTKQFTATAILRLEMQGKLSVRDRISKFFDNVPADKIEITIHDLLRHQSGLPSHVGGDFDPVTQEDFLHKVFTSTLKFNPGTKFSYSNVGYSLLALIIEKASGKSYEAYLNEYLWKPAGMEMTGYSLPLFEKSKMAIGYKVDYSSWGMPFEKKWNGDAPYWHLKGNGGILSTVEDLYKWHKALSSNIILPEETMDKLYSPDIRSDETRGTYYAYGWDVRKTVRNTTQIGHNGTNHIFYADFVHFPDEQLTLIMLSNKFNIAFNRLNFEIAKMIFNPDYFPEIPAADNEINRNFTQHIIKTIEQHGWENAKVQYEKREASASLIEYIMRQEGFHYLDNESPDIALQVFEMNVLAYPRSANALQGLGEAYMETGKKELALKYFRESIRINPDNDFVNKMIINLSE